MIVLDEFLNWIFFYKVRGSFTEIVRKWLCIFCQILAAPPLEAMLLHAERNHFSWLQTFENNKTAEDTVPTPQPSQASSAWSHLSFLVPRDTNFSSFRKGIAVLAVEDTGKKASLTREGAVLYLRPSASSSAVFDTKNEIGPYSTILMLFEWVSYLTQRERRIAVHNCMSSLGRCAP